MSAGLTCEMMVTFKPMVRLGSLFDFTVNRENNFIQNSVIYSNHVFFFKCLSQINEDLFGEVKFLSQTGPFAIPLQCTTKKCDVSNYGYYTKF